MARKLTLTITAANAESLKAALESLAQSADDRDFDAEGIADDFGDGYSDGLGGYAIAAECEEVEA